AEHQGLLVLADAWYPGWRATVDGVETEVFAVDGMFRGVSLGAGGKEVVFRYAPRSLGLGFLVSASAGLVTLLGLGWLACLRVRARLSLRRAASGQAGRLLA
ncbi:MAG TPA: hypothetical protein ENN80_06310, partial [Candidatus Hydrogenedentes bacterium]|nr:hypothetical protein [Candidatus Hydrogenedentota bacterium]